VVALGKDSADALSELDTVDLEAIALSHAWGISNGHTERIPPSPCPRTDCGGSVLIRTASDGVSSALEAPGPRR
jgi:hypothetical protein